MIISIAGAVIFRLFWADLVLELDAALCIDHGYCQVAWSKEIAAGSATTKRKSIPLNGMTKRHLGGLQGDL